MLILSEKEVQNLIEVRPVSLRSFLCESFLDPLSPGESPLKTGSSPAGWTDNSPHRTL